MVARVVLQARAMRFFTSLGALIASSTIGCAGIGIAKEAPPPAPPQAEPHIPDLPAEPPAPGHARIVLDANGEPAKVSRVTAVPNFEPKRTAQLNGKTSLASARMEEPLCITPCAVDMRHGLHTFVFTHTRDPLRSSTADVTVPSRGTTTIVRHAMGKEGHINGGYVGGAMLGLFGSGVTLMGATVTAFGVFGQPTTREDGTKSDPSILVVPGLVILGAGLAMLLGGGYLMSENRPVQQPGATTTWTKGSPPTAAPEARPESKTDVVTP
jgi:hypothetical protein